MHYSIRSYFVQQSLIVQPIVKLPGGVTYSVLRVPNTNTTSLISDSHQQPCATNAREGERTNTLKIFDRLEVYAFPLF